MRTFVIILAFMFLVVEFVVVAYCGWRIVDGYLLSNWGSVAIWIVLYLLNLTGLVRIFNQLKEL